MTNCKVTGNKAEASESYGGGIALVNSTLTSKDCIVSENTAVKSEDVYTQNSTIN